MNDKYIITYYTLLRKRINLTIMLMYAIIRVYFGKGVLIIADFHCAGFHLIGEIFLFWIFGIDFAR